MRKGNNSIKNFRHRRIRRWRKELKMKNILRKILRNLLGKLSKKAIVKHNAEVILVTGWTGSSIVRELVYYLLSDEFNVRRNVTEVWWDLSIPLTILGYEDRKRNLFEWSFLVIRTFFSLIFKPKYPHKIIINLDTSYEDTAKFWSYNINPHIVVVLKEKPQSKVFKMLTEREGSEKILFVYNPKLFKDLGTKQNREFIYSDSNSDLQYEKRGDILEVKYKSDIAKLSIPARSRFIWEFIPAALSVGILEGLSLKELVLRLAHFDFHPKQLKKVVSKLKEFIHSDER